MKNVITLGKKQLIEFLQTYNKGVRSTFGLQKSLHQAAQALGKDNWHALEPELQEDSGSMLSSARSGRQAMETCFIVFYRMDDHDLARSIETILSGAKFARAPLRGLFAEKDFNATFGLKITQDLQADELHMAPFRWEVTEWFMMDWEPIDDDSDEAIFEFSFAANGWTEDELKIALEGVIKPLFEHLAQQHAKRSPFHKAVFQSASLCRSYKYYETTKLA